MKPEIVTARQLSTGEIATYAVQFHRNDVRALRKDGWKLLTEVPTWHTGPVERISVPKGKAEVH